MCLSTKTSAHMSEKKTRVPVYDKKSSKFQTVRQNLIENGKRTSIHSYLTKTYSVVPTREIRSFGSPPLWPLRLIRIEQLRCRKNFTFHRFELEKFSCREHFLCKVGLWRSGTHFQCQEDIFKGVQKAPGRNSTVIDSCP